jgi:hypothetical protein
MKLIRTALLILCVLALVFSALAQSPTPPPDTILKQLRTELKAAPDAPPERGPVTRSSSAPSIDPIRSTPLRLTEPRSAGKLDENAPAHFEAGDFDLSLYGKGTLHASARSEDDIEFSGGIGGTYWLTRGLGIGGVAELADFRHSVFDQASGRVTVRAPLWDTIAPYGFGEGGYDFERERVTVATGGGIEFRFAQGWGVFGEAGLGLTTRGEGYGLARAGIRLILF